MTNMLEPIEDDFDHYFNATRRLVAESSELRAENERLRETIAEWQEIHGTFSGDVHAACQAEIKRLRALVARHHRHINTGLCDYCGTAWQT